MFYEYLIRVSSTSCFDVKRIGEVSEPKFSAKVWAEHEYATTYYVIAHNKQYAVQMALTLFTIVNPTRI